MNIIAISTYRPLVRFDDGFEISGIVVNGNEEIVAFVSPGHQIDDFDSFVRWRYAYDQQIRLLRKNNDRMVIFINSGFFLNKLKIK
jgi:hypothetical protein